MTSTYWQRFSTLIQFKSAPTELEIQMHSTDWVVIYATQGGRAKKLAENTANLITQTHQTVTLASLAQINPKTLQGLKRVLFIVSTFGDGRAPDHAVRFSKKMKKTSLDLSQLHYGLLALGNSDYDVFCAFGHTLNRWLVANHAVSLFELITVDKMAKPSIQDWKSQITLIQNTTQ